MRSKLVVGTLAVAVAVSMASHPVVSEADSQSTGKQIKDDSDHGDTAAGIGARFATTRANTSHPGDPSWISVVVFTDSGSQVDGEGFSVLALCP